MGPPEVIVARRAERAALLASAGAFVESLDPGLGVCAAVVFGSVARGDFNLWSDIDLLVVAHHLSTRPLDRAAALGPRPARLEVVAWAPAQWLEAVRKRNPIAQESASQGVWLSGSLAGLDGLAASHAGEALGHADDNSGSRS